MMVPLSLCYNHGNPSGFRENNSVATLYIHPSGFNMKQKVDYILIALHGIMFTKHWNRLTKFTFRKSRNERKTADCLRSAATSFRSLANDADF
jgi:hypothetical protein